ncbi:M12 family metallo-peptidase [Methanolobus sp.]|jgi:hypothetical protein|uniref:M12 family metallo-peptidase n=1 Tax=Methanolobus sp. TaxID=1874737 RepID=UPI0025D2C9EC|nr:M12 family metallo-peptidase [Methanolobus sp.]
MNKKSVLSTLFVIATLLNVAVMPVFGSSADHTLNNENGIVYTETQLNALYAKYSITENDIKFAKGELPNMLKGTILCREKRVIVTEDGKPLEGMKKGVDYDIIISESKMLNIIEKAEATYINKWGVDPSNPKIDIVDGIAIPTEEVKKLVKSNQIKVSDSPVESAINDKLVSITSVSSNPKAVSNVIYLHVYPAKDSGHTPGSSSNYYSYTIDASERFENFGIAINRVWHYNFWDASDVASADSSSDLLADLKDDSSYVRDSSNDIVLGWVDYMDNNGRAYLNGAYSVCATSAAGVDWPHDSIVQHEISHNFGANDQNSLFHPTCIMNYVYAYTGTDVWCTSCANTVRYGIFH